VFGKDNILKRFQPVVLEDVYPARVAADGNCLYRAISKVICGNEALFILFIRIFTLLEILSYPMFYDCDHKRFVDLIADNNVVVKQILLPVVVGNMSELTPLTLHSMHTCVSYLHMHPSCQHLWPTEYMLTPRFCQPLLKIK
jgi:hypothetical protein